MADLASILPQPSPISRTWKISSCPRERTSVSWRLSSVKDASTSFLGSLKNGTTTPMVQGENVQ